MRLLVDTNIFLEVLLEQAKAEDARLLLAVVENHEFLVSDFSLHSIGLLLFRRGQFDVFKEFLADAISGAGTAVVSLAMPDMESVVESARSFRLDFDDAYQYALAEKHDLIIVSFDSDFDRTKRGRKTPAEIVGAAI